MEIAKFVERFWWFWLFLFIISSIILVYLFPPSIFTSLIQATKDGVDSVNVLGIIKRPYGANISSMAGYAIISGGSFILLISSIIMNVKTYKRSKM